MAEEILLTKELTQERNGDLKESLPKNGAAQADLQFSTPQETLAPFAQTRPRKRLCQLR